MQIIYIFLFLVFLGLLRTRYSRGLNEFNGPFLASFTDFWKVWYAKRSTQKQFYVDIHEKYGDVVRIGPNELSFSDPQAIRDIYGTHGAQKRVSVLSQFSFQHYYQLTFVGDRIYRHRPVCPGRNTGCPLFYLRY
jgi:hypothetical protein